MFRGGNFQLIDSHMLRVCIFDPLITGKQVEYGHQEKETGGSGKTSLVYLYLLGLVPRGLACEDQFQNSVLVARLRRIGIYFNGEF